MKVAGIDVSAKTVTVVIRRQERVGKPREFTNTHPGHAALVKALQTAAVTHVCLRALPWPRSHLVSRYLHHPRYTAVLPGV